jgi:hypothetical protein
MIFLIHGHFDLKMSHFDSKNHLPDDKTCILFKEATYYDITISIFFEYELN